LWLRVHVKLLRGRAGWSRGATQVAAVVSARPGTSSTCWDCSQAHLPRESLPMRLRMA
jgi:hypothetical protein